MVSETPFQRLRRGFAKRGAPPAEAGEPRGFSGVRLSLSEAHGASAAAPMPRAPWSLEPINILALSGGAAGGAYGAGLLVGLGRAGRRPRFAIVTGVSTGALMAPFAFLGPEWDERLTDAYVGGHAGRLLAVRAVSGGLGAGMFRSEALDALIAMFVDDALLAAVAAQHALGRRLFVATTDLDRQRACIWDMGAIASQAATAPQGAALALFRNVLAASASLPGLFPPKMIACESEGGTYEEMHVDGGVAAPLFVLPDALVQGRTLSGRLRGGRVYLVVNTVLEPGARTTPSNVPAILIRSFDTMLRFSYRQAVSVTAALCAGAGIPLDIASIPPSPTHGSMMSFDTASMRRMFDTALEDAAKPDVWRHATPEPAGLAGMFPWPLRGERA